MSVKTWLYSLNSNTENCRGAPHSHEPFAPLELLKLYHDMCWSFIIWAIQCESATNTEQFIIFVDVIIWGSILVYVLDTDILASTFHPFLLTFFSHAAQTPSFVCDIRSHCWLRWNWRDEAVCFKGNASWGWWSTPLSSGH